MGYTEAMRHMLDAFVLDVYQSGAFRTALIAICYLCGSFFLYFSGRALVPSDGKGTLTPDHIRAKVGGNFIFALVFMYAPTLLDSVAFSLFVGNSVQGGKFGYAELAQSSAAPWASLGILLNMLGYVFAIKALLRGRAMAVAYQGQARDSWFAIGTQLLAGESMIHLKLFMVALGAAIGRGDLGKGVFY
jgi:hypothetical protein